MSKVDLSGALIDSFSVSGSGEQKKVDIHIQANWSEEFCNKFDVQTPTEKFGKSPVTVKLNCANFVLTPRSAEMKKQELDINCSLAHKFNYVPRLAKDGSVQRRELHFVIVAGGQAVAAMLEAYKDVVGDYVANLKLTYNEQSKLDLEDGEEAETEGEEETPVRGRKRAAAKEALQ